jgi:hypothetical protein
MMLRPRYRNGKDTPSLTPDSAESRSRTRFGTRVLNWEFDSTEAARTGSVGVRQADMTSPVAMSVLNKTMIKAAQMSQPKVITGPRRMAMSFHPPPLVK